jgi:hypothetical protein
MALNDDARPRLSAEKDVPCVHCGAPVRPANDDWIHAHGLYRCQSSAVAYGHLAHPAGVPCRADGPNPCLGASVIPPADGGTR